ncbi:MAG: hypothetical protein PHX18_07350 [Candidatus Gastranaerophilales bacterium]|nr:hypothetical protein [Candidatus Gastranaerophilales bacterium]
MRFISCAVLLALILFSTGVNAEVIPLSNFSKVAYNTQSDYTPLDDMEQRLFAKTFAQENNYKRLNRIENKIFNKTFSELPVNIRIQNILEAINNNKTNDMAIRYLDFAESQIFSRTYPQNDPSERLERLEIQVFGAVQPGNILSRIENIKRATTNVASGGYGLQYVKPYNNYTTAPIVDNQPKKKSLFQSLAPVIIPFLGNYTNTAPNSYSYGPYDQTYSSYNNYNPNNNYMQFGGMGSNSYNSSRNGARNDFGNNYGIGGGVRILED